MRLGERIKKRRIELNWTQDELCRRAKISKGFLSDVENGKRSIGAETLLDLARVLSLSLDYLMTGDPSETLPNEEIEIPAGLARFAEQEGLSFRNTLAMLDMQRQIIAHRSSSKEEGLDEVDWRNFYNAVKDYL
jgi:transcriptional regulator with XRE-family HTH domain